MKRHNILGLWVKIVVCLGLLWSTVDSVSAAPLFQRQTSGEQNDLPFFTSISAGQVFSTTGVISAPQPGSAIALTLTVQLYAGHTPTSTTWPTSSVISWVVPISAALSDAGDLPFTLTLNVGALGSVAPEITIPPTLALSPTPSPTSSPTPAAPTITPSATPTSSTLPMPVDENMPTPPSDQGNPPWAQRLQALPSPELWMGGAALFVVGFAILIWRVARRRKATKRKRASGEIPVPSLVVPAAVPPQPVLEKASAPTAYLELPGGDASQRFALLAEGTTLGRAKDNTLVIDASSSAWETVSAYHARIFYVDNDWRVEDLNSHNGVYVNGRRTGRNLLRDGWEISIGNVRFIFHTEGVYP